MKLPPLNAVHYFITAAQFKSFRQAAKELNVTEGAISRQIKLLSQYYNQALFYKVGRGVELTEVGELLLQTAGPAFTRVSQVSEKIMTNPKQLSIAVTTSFAVRWLLPKLAKFEQAFPQYQLQLQASSREGSLDIHSFDIQIIYRLHPVVSSCYEQQLMAEKLIPVCAPSYLKSGKIISAQDLATKKILLNEVTARDWTKWSQTVGLDNLNLSNAIKFEQDDVAIQAAIAGYGIALANEAYIQNELQLGSLVPAMKYPAIPIGAHYIASHRSLTEYTPQMLAFTQWLKAQVAEIQHSDIT